MGVSSYVADAPINRRVRAYFAPVNRSSRSPVVFDPSNLAAFLLDSPPSPWVSLGWIRDFQRRSTSKSVPVQTGIPASPLEQVRETISASVQLQFQGWTKLTMALSTGAQHMNILDVRMGASSGGCGGQAQPAMLVQGGSSATFIALGAVDAAKLAVGSIIALDADYTGQTGYVGSPVSGAYVRQPLADIDYIRRVTFNVGLVVATSSTGITLASGLLGGTPAPGSKLQVLSGFVDREGGTFYQEWSGLFIQEGSQGERVAYYYPRLQSCIGASEGTETLDVKQRVGLSRILLKGEYLALPVTDPLDGERVVCYRSYIPSSSAMV